MSNLAAYLGLMASVFTAFFLLAQAYVLLTEENVADGSALRKEIFLSCAFAILFLSLFLLVRNAGWIISALAKIFPFSADYYREYSSVMVILGCLTALPVLRFRRRFMIAGLYFTLMLVSVFLYGIWRVNYFGFNYIDREVWNIALGYTPNGTMQDDLLLIAVAVLLLMVVLFKVPKRIRESAEKIPTKSQITQLAVALTLMAAFAVPMLDTINPSLIVCDPPNTSLWGGVRLIAIAPDGNHVYYSQTHGPDEKVNSGHTPVFRLYYASLVNNEVVEIPQPIAMTGGFPSPSGKYLLAIDKSLIVMNSSSYHILKRIKVPDESRYGWMGSDDEIWYFNGQDGSVTIRNIRSGAIRKTDISQPDGISWSKDHRYALWLKNFEYDDPNTISIYDYKNNKSIKVVAAGNNQDEILCATLSNDNKSVYYVIKEGKGDNGSLYLRVMNIVNRNDVILAKTSSLFHISQLKITREGDRLLYDGYKDGNPDTPGIDREFSVFMIDLLSGKTRKLVSNKKNGFSWDYCPKNNKLIWNDDFKPEFQGKTLD